MPEAKQDAADFKAEIYGRYVSSGAAGYTPNLDQDHTAALHHLRHVARTFFPADRQARIVDIGCGHGNFLRVSKELGYSNLAGVDLSQEQVSLAHRFGVDVVQCGDMMQFLRTQPSSSIDVVISFDILEHLTKPTVMEVMREVRRCIRPTGCWLIHVPNGASPFVGRILHGDFTHETAFTTQSLRTLLRSHDFGSIEFFEDAPVPHGIVSFIRAMLWKILSLCCRAFVAIETGQWRRPAIYTQNLLAVARPQDTR